MSDPLNEYIRTHARHLASGITEDTALLEQGLLDSLTLVRLIAFLEKQYHIIVPDEAITADNFGNLASIRRLIDSLAGKGQMISSRKQG